MPTTFLRPAWFLDIFSWDVASARDTGIMHSFLAPLDRRFSMMAAQDVGRVSARIIQESWSGTRVVELEGPRRVSPNDLAEAFSRALRRPVRAETVPRASWEALFRKQGMKNPVPRMRMLDGFNDGWIDFPDRGTHALKGTVTADDVIAALVASEDGRRPLEDV